MNNYSEMMRGQKETEARIKEHIKEFLAKEENGTLTMQDKYVLEDYKNMQKDIEKGDNPIVVYQDMLTEWKRRDKKAKEQARDEKRLIKLYISKAGYNGNVLNTLRDQYLVMIDNALGIKNNKVIPNHPRDWEAAYNYNLELSKKYAEIKLAASLKAQEASKQQARDYPENAKTNHTIALRLGVEYYEHMCETIASTIDTYRGRLNIDETDSVQEAERQTDLYHSLKKKIVQNEEFLEAKIVLSRDVLDRIMSFYMAGLLFENPNLTVEQYLEENAKGKDLLDIHRQFKVLATDSEVELLSDESREKYSDVDMFNELVELSNQYKDYDFKNTTNINPFEKDSIYEGMFTLISEEIFEIKDLKGLFLGFSQIATLSNIPYVKNIDNAILAIAAMSEEIDLYQFIFKEDEMFGLTKPLQSLDDNEIREVYFKIRDKVEEQFGYEKIADLLNKYTNKLADIKDPAVLANRCTNTAKLTKDGLSKLLSKIVTPFVEGQALTPRALLAASLYSLYTMKLLDNLRVINGIEALYNDFINEYTIDAFAPFIEKLNYVVNEYPYTTPYEVVKLDAPAKAEIVNI